MEEVDHFADFLCPQLERNGFSGIFVEKRNSPCLEFTPNNGPDGCALFYRSSKLLLMKKKDIALKREDGSESNQVALMVQLRFKGESQATDTDKRLVDSERRDIRSTDEQGSDNEAQAKRTEDLSSSNRSEARTICVAVTHLKAKREGRELRNAQGRHLFAEVASFADGLPIVVCGDFNATPDEPVYEYFSGRDSNSQRPLALASSYASRYYGDKEPPLTSWKFRPAGESQYTIDYIWFTSDSLKVDSIWTLPTEEEIGPNGLPSPSYPSDHLSLCSCFRL